MSAFTCLNVSPECPVEASIYGYYPSLPANVFFAAFFGAFTSAGIYLLLKHVVIGLGPEYSHLQPRYYTWIFISCDIFSLVCQGIGGGLAATAGQNTTLLNSGSHLMLAGIVIQVFTLIVFGVFAAMYLVRVQANKSSLKPEATTLLHSTKFHLFISGVLFAYTCVLIRCIYRIPELSGGWKSAVMQNETDFIVLDGVMVACATFALTVFHPGYWFPSLNRHEVVSEKRESSSGSV
ncbi:MAG: hypothetical protein MMC33_007279 [Icmadophila ericetorum]|nr:hypothetical protein [Icmadophila ericetorum]